MRRNYFIRLSKSLCLLGIMSVSLFCNVLLTDAVIDGNTVAVWLFEEGGGKVVRDASGNGHDGEIIGNLNSVRGKFGKALDFPGDGSAYIVVDSTKKLELETLSIEAWVKVASSTGKWQGIVCKQKAGCTNRNYGIWVNVNLSVLHAQIGANGGCAFNMNGTTEITDNVWHHLAFTFDGKVGKVYVDGVLESEKDNTNTFQSDDPITIGVPNIGNVGGLLGTIDEIRISNVARTEKEINEMKDVGLAQILSVNPGEKLTTLWGYMKHVP